MTDRLDAAWQAQEAARAGQGGDTADRLVAQALARPVPMALPADFAAQVARLARQRLQAASSRVEWALAAVAVALVLLASAWALHLNPELPATLAAALPTQGLGGWALWLLAALAATALAPALTPPRKSP